MEEFYNETLNKLEIAINGLEIEGNSPNFSKRSLRRFTN